MKILSFRQDTSCIRRVPNVCHTDSIKSDVCQQLAVSLAFVFSLIFFISAASASDIDPNQLFGPHTNGTDFKEYVDRLQEKAPAGRRERNAFLSQKLQELGFSCNPISRKIQLECVKFGCINRDLIQRSVVEGPGTRDNIILHASITNYTWLKSCFKPSETIQEQIKFLNRG